VERRELKCLCQPTLSCPTLPLVGLQSLSLRILSLPFSGPYQVDYYPLLEVRRCPLFELVVGCNVSVKVATCRRLTSEARTLYTIRKTSLPISLRHAIAATMLHTEDRLVPHLPPQDPLVLKLLNDYFPDHVCDAAQEYAASVPPPPPYTVVNQADKAAANAMSDSDSSPAPTPAELAAQQVASGLTKAIAESMQFSGKGISLEKRKRRAKKAIDLAKELAKACKQLGTLKRAHDVDVVKHHLVACTVKLAKLTDYSGADFVTTFDALQSATKAYDSFPAGVSQ
jgi:ribosomal protein L32